MNAVFQVVEGGADDPKVLEEMLIQLLDAMLIQEDFGTINQVVLKLKAMEQRGQSETEARLRKQFVAKMGAVGIVSAVNSGVMIHRFQEEVGDFDRVLASAEPRRRLVYLPLDESSSTAKFMPFHHFGAYYRARIGGVAELSFAELPQSPVRYRREVEPPQRPWGWEWEPRLRPQDARYYDYVLSRGGDPFGEVGREGWQELSREGKWALYVKTQR